MLRHCGSRKPLNLGGLLGGGQGRERESSLEDCKNKAANTKHNSSFCCQKLLLVEVSLPTGNIPGKFLLGAEMGEIGGETEWNETNFCGLISCNNLPRASVLWRLNSAIRSSKLFGDSFTLLMP